MRIDAIVPINLSEKQEKEVALHFLYSLLGESVYYNVEHDKLFLSGTPIEIDNLKDDFSIKMREVANAIRTIHKYGKK